MSAPKGQRPWNAGVGKGWVNTRGYKQCSVTENGKRRQLAEHRVLMEQHLGRRLSPREVVHHRNGDMLDNRIENLEVLDVAEHNRLHHNGSKRSDSARASMAATAQYRERCFHLERVNAEMLELLRATLAWPHSERPQDECEVVTQKIEALLARIDGVK